MHLARKSGGNPNIVRPEYRQDKNTWKAENDLRNQSWIQLGHNSDLCPSSPLEDLYCGKWCIFSTSLRLAPNSQEENIPHQIAQGSVLGFEVVVNFRPPVNLYS